LPGWINASGAFTEGVGVGNRPVNFLVDRGGSVRYAGLSPQGVTAAAGALADEPANEAPAPTPVGAAPGEDVKTVERAGFPPIDRSQRIENARDLRGKRGPRLEGVEWFEQPRPDLAGKVLFLEYYATWCGPCNAVKPKLKVLAEEFEDDVVFITISDEDRETVRPLSEDDSFAGLVVLDDHKKVFQYANVQAIPHTLIMSSDGVVRWQGNPHSLDAAVLRQIVEANRSLH